MGQTGRKDTLYHYTDFGALDGILSNAELRLNNVLNMNDASEMTFFMNSLCKAVAGRFREEGDVNRAKWTEKLFSAEKDKEFVYSAYAACFSCFRDDAAQWERYANHGRGVCIAFRYDLLKKMAVEPLSLQTVFYRDDVGEHELVGILYSLIRSHKAPWDTSPAIRAALNHAWAASAAYKHPSFSSEKEVRLVVSPFEQGFFNVQPRYHISNERIKKYYPVNLQKLCQIADTRIDEAIAELIIGPESTQSVPILQDYLRDMGYEKLAEKVTHSACPLRQKM
ncbi:MAG: DUF2971 domain-containing protein [Lachnospiraceae bacterium]|nr:DUF2971 domain-containing protein [Lachnospiraceae bacterium]